MIGGEDSHSAMNGYLLKFYCLKTFGELTQPGTLSISLLRNQFKIKKTRTSSFMETTVKYYKSFNLRGNMSEKVDQENLLGTFSTKTKLSHPVQENQQAFITQGRFTLPWQTTCIKDLKSSRFGMMNIAIYGMERQCILFQSKATTCNFSNLDQREEIRDSETCRCWVEERNKRKQKQHSTLQNM